MYASMLIRPSHVMNVREKDMNNNGGKHIWRQTHGHEWTLDDGKFNDTKIDKIIFRIYLKCLK